MLKNFIQKKFNWIFDNFKEDTSKMLIVTGTLSWILSSVAQVCGIIRNQKISSEKKSFLIPQEMMDAVVNVGAFFGITMFTKKVISKMARTGKIAPQSVRDFLNNSIHKDKVGKYNFDLDHIDFNNSKVADTYESYKNFVCTMGTIGASILSCNIVTPVIRNVTASRVQKTYIDMKNNPQAYQYQTSGNIKI